MEFVGLYEDMDICGNPGDRTTTTTATIRDFCVSRDKSERLNNHLLTVEW